jgi:CDGSH-type Zn-finger protein/uncharacterized Fe-S cluster protein YjdI
MPPSKRDIVIQSREQLLYTLTEASEIEHNLMCCYLYAAWSLKTEEDDGLEEILRQEIMRWQRLIIEVAIDEMTHLSLVANLMNAVGGTAYLNRPNFPIASGYHPAGLQVRLAPFNRDTLQHFIHLERPEGDDEPDGATFATVSTYERALHGLRLMPSAQDFDTVGHLYRSVQKGLVYLSEALGETNLFCGDRALQVGSDIVSLNGLVSVTDLGSALEAVETIVEQGEGASVASERGHFQRFISVRDAYDRLLAEDPAFEPAHKVAHNPVMRRPPDPTGRVWIQHAEPRGVLDLANALYNHLLRLLAQSFAATDTSEKRHLINAAIDMMAALDPLARELARLEANDLDGCHAGISFATLRSLAAVPGNADPSLSLSQRFDELIEGAGALKPTPRVTRAVDALKATAVRFQVGRKQGKEISAKPMANSNFSLAAEQALTPEAGQTPEVVEGDDLTLIFDGRRCIHARFCVTGAPKTFLANVEGPWLHPDETATSQLIEVAHACPSGAVAYRRKDGGPEEAEPAINVMRLRENGPYAFHAPLVIAGLAAGYRATLCRCGASKHKPYCDGSHHDIEFVASGEPQTISLDPLEVRDGSLKIDPIRDGPLKFSGSLEICSGTGRVIKRASEARLCRCGQSRSKPFCDGSHRAANFQADGL